MHWRSSGSPRGSPGARSAWSRPRRRRRQSHRQGPIRPGPRTEGRTMELYPWVVFIHVASVVLTFFAHGASAATALKLRSEREPARIAALLDLSGSSLAAAGIGLL